MLNNKGFTLIETLFVLFIICILSSLTMIYHQPTKKSETVLKEMSMFLNQAKMEAMLSKQTVTVNFNNDYITYSSLDKEKEYRLIEGAYIEDYQLTFNAYGNINKAKTITYHFYDQQFQFVYQVGSGSFYVQ